MAKKEEGGFILEIVFWELKRNNYTVYHPTQCYNQKEPIFYDFIRWGQYCIYLEIKVSMFNPNNLHSSLLDFLLFFSPL